MDELARFAKVEGVSGTLVSANWSADIPSARIGDVEMHSKYLLRDVAVDRMYVDQIEFNSNLENGVLKSIRCMPLRARGESMEIFRST